MCAKACPPVPWLGGLRACCLVAANAVVAVKTHGLGHQSDSAQGRDSGRPGEARQHSLHRDPLHPLIRPLTLHRAPLHATFGGGSPNPTDAWSEATML